MFLHAQNKKYYSLLAASQFRFYDYMPWNFYQFRRLGSFVAACLRVAWRRVATKLVSYGNKCSRWSACANTFIGFKHLLATTKTWAGTFHIACFCRNILRSFWTVFWLLFTKNYRYFDLCLAFLRDYLWQPEKYVHRSSKKVRIYNFPGALL